MAKVDEFLEQNPGLTLGDSIADSDFNGVKLEVKIIGISSKHVKFSHLGTDYLIAKEHVLDIAERVDPAVSGKAVTLTLCRDASLLASYSVTAEELGSSLPFSLSRPSPLPRHCYTLSPKEIAWRQAVRYGSEYPPLDIYLDPYSSVSGSPTGSYGVSDDSGPDDTRPDY